MAESSTTRLSTRQSRVFGMEVNAPGILVAHAPRGAVTADRCLVQIPFTVGRSSDCSFPVSDGKVSKHHFVIQGGRGNVTIEDFGSTNGTFVNGVRLLGKAPCPDAAVIRIGKAVLVFHGSAGPMLEPPPVKRFGIRGPFHAGAILQGLMEAAHSKRHVLLVGPSGAGKELAAGALATMLGDTAPLPVVDYNAARFTSEDEATATLFGVGQKVFSDVDPRPGLIEQAKGGVLFLDEMHNLPTRVQRTLLRTIEDNQYARIGESRSRPADVQFVLAANEPGPSFGLAHDLLARLRVIAIPPLKDRVADIPDIFNSALTVYLQENGIEPEGVMSELGADHYEAMCIDGFERSNVRGILDLADRLVSKLVTGVAPKRAVGMVFGERFGQGPVALRRSGSLPSAPASLPAPHSQATEPMPVMDTAIGSDSHYEVYKDKIVTAYRQCDGNLTATERMLRSGGIPCTRRWLGIYLKKWGVR